MIIESIAASAFKTEAAFAISLAEEKDARGKSYFPKIHEIRKFDLEHEGPNSQKRQTRASACLEIPSWPE
ncbi:hypothetical protein ASF91_19420 [Rhizobium sp. Leaf155]|nr:hypothetical protein ASF91_19420 [Rhizobium sp. Leaf155]